MPATASPSDLSPIGGGPAGPEQAVKERYGQAALAREAALCCPVDYDPQYLEMIPDAVLERDYGCGDPSRYVREGDCVLDLGSGGGKICFIASQIVGPKGRVIGVDMTSEMLRLSREAAPEVAERLGYANVEFHRGQIQDLTLDADQLDAWLGAHPVQSVDDLEALDAERQRLRRDAPMVPDASVDIVVSNCVLNLVGEAQREALIGEIFRTLKVGGRIAISDIVSDELVPDTLRADETLWSGCVSGAFHELEILRKLEEAGFHGIAIDKWADAPFAVVEGIEFRSVTITAHKGKQGPCLEANQAVVYRGPWKQVEDDDGHVLVRGVRTAVCAKTFALYTRDPYANEIIPIAPRVPIPETDRQEFDCRRSTARDPRESKGSDYHETREAGDGGCC
jgi:ubiquinone/menaquinone biosynthesis C-methylase UbiE